jgi:hypothetical protein
VAQPGPITRRLDTPAGQAGVTLQHPNATELARALEQLTDPAVRRGMGARGQQVAQMMPTAADVARQFVDVVALARDLRYAGAGQPG